MAAWECSLVLASQYWPFSRHVSQLLPPSYSHEQAQPFRRSETPRLCWFGSPAMGGVESLAGTVGLPHQNELATNIPASCGLDRRLDGKPLGGTFACWKK